MKDFKIIIEIIKRYVEISMEESKTISATFNKHRYKKNTILLSEGQVCNKIYFLLNGLIREYMIDDVGGEVTTQFAAENTFFYSTLSYLNCEPSTRYIETLEACTLIIIEKERFNKLLIEIPQLHLFLNKVYESTIINFEKRTELLKIKGAHNRLATYETIHPEFIGRISNKQIASYLNLSPETLSRAKSKEYNSRNG